MTFQAPHNSNLYFKQLQRPGSKTYLSKNHYISQIWPLCSLARFKRLIMLKNLILCQNQPNNEQKTQKKQIFHDFFIPMGTAKMALFLLRG